jgi:hypothetical protein
MNDENNWSRFLRASAPVWPSFDDSPADTVVAFDCLRVGIVGRVFDFGPAPLIPPSAERHHFPQLAFSTGANTAIPSVGRLIDTMLNESTGKTKLVANKHSCQEKCMSDMDLSQ